MANQVIDNVTIENAKIIFRNFSGKPSKYNSEGQRNFCVILEDRDLAAKMKEDGWNIRELQPREEGEDPVPYLQVAVSFDNIPPMVKLITKNNQTVLGDGNVNMLDWADILNVDLIIRPYNWEVNGKSGVKAYLKSLYVTIQEDELAAKYEQPEQSVDDIPF